jgi:DNA-directed RNA polymerase subunit N (RpoN/RPB10)
MLTNALSIRCWHCGHLHEVGDRGRLIHAHTYRLPIFPRRCRTCGMTFTDASLSYLREVATRFMDTYKPEEMHSLEVRMIPRSRTGPVR